MIYFVYLLCEGGGRCLQERTHWNEVRPIYHIMCHCAHFYLCIVSLKIIISFFCMFWFKSTSEKCLINFVLIMHAAVMYWYIFFVEFAHSVSVSGPSICNTLSDHLRDTTLSLYWHFWMLLWKFFVCYLLILIRYKLFVFPCRIVLLWITLIFDRGSTEPKGSRASGKGSAAGLQ